MSINEEEEEEPLHFSTRSTDQPLDITHTETCARSLVISVDIKGKGSFCV